MQPSAETVPPAWTEIEDGVTWATAGTGGRGTIRLMVERLPDGWWEWMAWRANRPTDFVNGCRATRETACAAAEGAATHMMTIARVPPDRLHARADDHMRHDHPP